jgi:5'-nucleotidase
MLLLTNDDGIRAPGIVAMYKALARDNPVQVIAPETVQSATGHGITLSGPLMTHTVNVENVFTGTSVEGRPADCVKLALWQLVEQRPQYVVSGINSGANVGINVIYSGTVAAAIEAGFLGVQAFAVSLLLDREVTPNYDAAALIAMDVIAKVRKLIGDAPKVVSINVPALRVGEKPAGVRLVRQSTAPWEDAYEKRLDPRGKAYFWNTSVFKLADTEQDTDVAALRDKFVTVTPLKFDMTDKALMTELAKAM